MSDEKHLCEGRREFLITAVAGGLALTLSNPEPVAGQKKKASQTEVILKLGDGSSLEKMGGFHTFDTKFGKVLVVRTGEISFKAFSGLCPHKGGPLKFDETTKQLVCPWHDSKFDMDGKKIEGPSETSLKTFPSGLAIAVSQK